MWGPPGRILRANKEPPKKENTNKMSTGLSRDFMEILFTCFCSPIRNDLPKYINYHFLSAQFQDNPPNLFVFMRFLSLQTGPMKNLNPLSIARNFQPWLGDQQTSTTPTQASDLNVIFSRGWCTNCQNLREHQNFSPQTGERQRGVQISVSFAGGGVHNIEFGN